MDVNFEYYKIFYYVAKYNNFTRAARVLGNSQPNVTRAMNCLEQQLHCTPGEKCGCRMEECRKRLTQVLTAYLKLKKKPDF